MTDICLPIDAVGGSPSFVAASHRAAQAALMLGRSDRGLGAVSGIRPGIAPTINATAAQWSVTRFCGIADPESSLTIGPYLVAFTATKTGAMTAADASFARLDRLDVQVPDDPAGATTVPVIVYTAGVPAATPALPAAPARSFPLAQISVPKAGSGSPSVTATFPYTVASGGIAPSANSSVYPAHPYAGQITYDVALDRLYRWNGSAWKFVAGSNVAQMTVSTGGQALTAGSATKVTGAATGTNNWTADYNDGGLSIANSQYVAIESGDYELVGSVAVTPAAGMTRLDAVVAVNGTSKVSTHGGVAGTGNTIVGCGPKRLPLAAGDVVDLRTFVSGAGGTIAAGDTWLSVKRVG